MITVQLKLIPAEGQDKLLKKTAEEYISSANDLLEYCCAQVGVPKLSSSSFSAPLPSAVKNEVVNTVKSILRKHRARRKALGKAKKQKAINRLGNKEQRWMRDQDHKVSREIVNFAISNGIGTIRMEKLANIRKTARTSRKNEKNLHTWSFYRLANYIEYKAGMAGVEVEYVDPARTSQLCPRCGKANHARDRKYQCACGYKGHRDRVGAINIISAPVVACNRLPA